MSKHPEIDAVLAGESDGCIVTGDCLEVMAGMPDGCVDAVVTDPPYGIGYAEWDRQLPDMAWLRHARRIAAIVSFTPRTGQIWKYPPADWVLCWHRPGSVQRTKIGRFSHWEPVLIYGDNPYWVDARTFVADTKSAGIAHPCPKPLPVMEWLVEPCGNLILDPFCGSGTTCVAAKKLGRRWIGVEIDPKYADVARDRVEKAPRPMRPEDAGEMTDEPLAFF